MLGAARGVLVVPVVYVLAFLLRQRSSEGPEGESLSQTGLNRHNLSLEYEREGKGATIYQQGTVGRHWTAPFQHQRRQKRHTMRTASRQF
jgi:hypothetical protein